MIVKMVMVIKLKQMDHGMKVNLKMEPNMVKVFILIKNLMSNILNFM